MREKNRYTLVEYKCKVIKTLDSASEYEELVRKLKKLNDKSDSSEYYANVSYVTLPSGRLNVTIHVYHKLSKKSSLKELDKITSKYTKGEYIYENKDSFMTRNNILPDINIAYFQSNKDNRLDLSLKYIPALFKDDVKYLDPKFYKDYVTSMIQNKDINFFVSLANRFCTYKTKIVPELTEKLFMEANEAEFGLKSIDRLYDSAIKLYDALKFERDKNGNKVFDGTDYVKSYRRIRDIGLFIKSYDTKEKRHSTPFGYNEENNDEIKKVNDQISFLERQEKESDFTLEEEMLNEWDNMQL